MFKPIRSQVLVMTFLLVTLLLSGCNAPASDSSKLKVATGILPLKQFVSIIGGDHVEVQALIPLGANPHNYQPIPSSMKFLSDADLYVYVGVPTETDNIIPKLPDFNQDINIINLPASLSEHHPFLTGDEHHHDDESEEAHQEEHSDEHSEENTDEHSDEHTDADHDHESGQAIVFEALMLAKDDSIGAYSDYDPHTWVSPKRAITMVESIANAMAESDPSHKDDYLNNAKKLIEELNALDSNIKAKVETLTSKTYLIYHSSYNYFAFDYGLSFVSVENEGKAPTIQDIQHAIDTAKSFDIHTLFYQNEFSVEQAKSISDEIKGNAVPLEPLSEDYFGSMQKLIDALD